MKKSLLLLAGSLSVLLVSGSAVAQGRGQERGQGQGQGNQERSHERGEDRRALSDSVRRVERRTGGQVLSAERVPYDGRDVNRVKVVDSSGRVRIYMDDPQSRDRGQGDRTRDDDD